LSKQQQSKKAFSIFDHVLVPKHEIVPDSEVELVLQSLNINSKEKLPKILSSDAAAKAIGAKKGDVIRIYRKELTGEVQYYRVVV